MPKISPFVRPKGSILFTLPPVGRASSSKFSKWSSENMHKWNHGKDVKPFEFPVRLVIHIVPGTDWSAKSIPSNYIDPVLRQLKACNYIKSLGSEHVRGIHLSIRGESCHPLSECGCETMIEVDCQRDDVD